MHQTTNLFPHPYLFFANFYTYVCFSKAISRDKFIVPKKTKDGCQDLVRLNMLFGPFGRTFGSQDYIASVRQSTGCVAAKVQLESFEAYSCNFQLLERS